MKIYLRLKRTFAKERTIMIEIEIVTETETKGIRVPIKSLTGKSKDQGVETGTEIDENVNVVNLPKATLLLIKTKTEIKIGIGEMTEIERETGIEIEDENVTELDTKQKYRDTTDIVQNIIIYFYNYQVNKKQSDALELFFLSYVLHFDRD